MNILLQNCAFANKQEDSNATVCCSSINCMPMISQGAEVSDSGRWNSRRDLSVASENLAHLRTAEGSTVRVDVYWGCRTQ